MSSCAPDFKETSYGEYEAVSLLSDLYGCYHATMGLTSSSWKHLGWFVSVPWRTAWAGLGESLDGIQMGSVGGRETEELVVGAVPWLGEVGKRES